MIPGVVAGQMRQTGNSTFAVDVAADTPYLWWRLGEVSGTALADNSGNSRPATLTGTAGTSYSLGQASLVGDTNAAILFRADSGYARSNSTFTLSLTNATFEVAFKANVSAGAGVISSLNQNASPTTATAARDRNFVLGSDGYLYFTFWDGTATRSIKSLATVNDGFRRLACTVIGTTKTEMFINGVSQGSVPYVPGASYASYLFIGLTNISDTASPIGTSAGFRGVIDEMLVFNSALSNARVLAHAQGAALA